MGGSSCGIAERPQVFGAAQKWRGARGVFFPEDSGFPRSGDRASGYGHGSGWGMRAGFRREIQGERKLERGADGHGEEAGIVEGEEFDFLRGRQNLGGFLFLLLGLLDRVAHRARVISIEGLFRTSENGSVLRGVGPDHICPGHGLKNSPVASNDKKQRNGGDELAAGCEDFSTEHGHRH
jgi:hypothetical protein